MDLLDSEELSGVDVQLLLGRGQVQVVMDQTEGWGDCLGRLLGRRDRDRVLFSRCGVWLVFLFYPRHKLYNTYPGAKIFNLPSI